MSQKEAQQVLTSGLLKGYAVQANPETIDVNGIVLKQSAPDLENGKYIDQWLEAHNGGGRELAINANQGLIRTYVGGVLPAERLEEIGVTEEQIITYLINTVKELGPKTRLYEGCSAESDSRFRYQYVLTGEEKEFGIVTAQEDIFFDDIKVFTHWFTLGPINI